MSDYKLNKNERIDVEEILKDLEHYHPRRRGWTWRQPAPESQLKQGPFQYRDISATQRFISKPSIPSPSRHPRIPSLSVLLPPPRLR